VHILRLFQGLWLLLLERFLKVLDSPGSIDIQLERCAGCAAGGGRPRTEARRSDNTTARWELRRPCGCD
jgi:hypothetical protein